MTGKRSLVTNQSKTKDGDVLLARNVRLQKSGDWPDFTTHRIYLLGSVKVAETHSYVSRILHNGFTQYVDSNDKLFSFTFTNRKS